MKLIFDALTGLRQAGVRPYLQQVDRADRQEPSLAGREHMCPDAQGASVSPPPRRANPRAGT
jgi:hypothetical protein